MIDQILLYLGALLPFFWGVAHLFPTKSVVEGFGGITLDNQRIITMEWINEGACLIFLGAVVAAVTYIDHTHATGRVALLVGNARREFRISGGSRSVSNRS